MSDQTPPVFPNEPPPAPPPVQPLPYPAVHAPLSASEERTWAMLAHLTSLINLFTGFLGVVAALVIYLVYKDRSRFVAYQAMQAFLFQLIAWLAVGFIAAFLWVIGVALSFILIGLIVLPLALLVSLIPFASIVYSIVGAVQTNEGRDFKYWLIGDWVRGIYSKV